MKRVFIGVKYLLVTALAALSITSCTKYPDPAVINEDYGSDTTVAAQRKVLLISIDGAAGAEMKTIAPPNITALQQQGKYTYSVYLDPSANTDASSWTTMMNGNFFSHHLILDSSFQVDLSGQDDDFEGTIPYYPDFFSFVYQAKANYKTAFISPWSQLVNNYADADFAYAVTDDAVVKDSAVALLGRENALGAMVVDFNEAEIAGLAGTFSASDDGYKTAILNADGYIGDIMSALKSRPNYSKENWLVIVTTNHGGSAASPKPGFIIYSNPSFSEKEVQKIGLSSVYFTGHQDGAITASVPNDNGLYDNGDLSKDFTVQMKIKVLASGSYPTFLSKSPGGAGGSWGPGWNMFLSGGNWSVIVGNKSKKQVSGGQGVGDGLWHTITMTVKTTNSKRWMTTYSDGDSTSTLDITSLGNINTTAPLKIGWITGDVPTSNDNFYAADLEYFNVALDPTTIANTLCLQDVTQHPNYANLIGFWPLDDAIGSTIANEAPGGYDMQLSGSYVWTALGSDVPCSMPTPPDITLENPSVLATNADIAPNILYWLQINQKNVGATFDASSWINNFEKEIYGL